MPIAFRHRTDPSPVMTELPGLAVHQERDALAMARLQRRTTEEIQLRFDDGHRAYVASIDGVPVAWGWVASSVARVGEVGATLSLGPGERYLWNFVTLAAFRGRGICPRLLNAMVLAESDEGERFWIAYAPENHASGAGIRKAGFVNVAEVSFDLEGRPAVKSVTLRLQAKGEPQPDERGTEVRDPTPFLLPEDADLFHEQAGLTSAEPVADVSGGGDEPAAALEE